MTKSKSLSHLDSMLLCEYILQRAGVMTHLKLQKILYYVQAFHLAYFDKELIEDDFQAWLHGPVSRKVYDKIKELSILYAEIKYDPEAFNPSPEIQLKQTLTSEQFDLINDVIDSYGKLNSTELENLSHSEMPWQKAREGYGVADRCEVIIPKEIMQTFYKEQLYGKEESLH